jgi:hypothetical protein
MEPRKYAMNNAKTRIQSAVNRYWHIFPAVTLGVFLFDDAAATLVLQMRFPSTPLLPLMAVGLAPIGVVLAAFIIKHTRAASSRGGRVKNKLSLS